MLSESAEAELLTPSEVAALLLIDRKTVTRWAETGHLAFVRTPGGHRRFLKSEMLAISAGSHRRHEHRAAPIAVPAQRSGDASHQLGTVGTSPSVLEAAVVAGAVAIARESEADQAARDVLQVAAAVTVAARKAAQAAEEATRARALAAKQAARAVAREAACTADRVRDRAEVAAAQVETAARRAVLQAMASADPAEHARTASLAASAGSRAKAVEQDVRRAAAIVAAAVVDAAAYRSRMTSAAECAYEHEVSRAAAQVHTLALDTATQVADQTRARAAGVALAAREAATAVEEVTAHQIFDDGALTPSEDLPRAVLRCV